MVLPMKQIQYFKIDGIDADYFACERLRATLSVATCASRYRASADGESYISCLRCPIGAKHAGVAVSDPSVATPKTCTRCFQQSTRMVLGRLCVTCYNRTRETLKGANSKGGVPKELPYVYTGHVGVCTASGEFKPTKVEAVAKFHEVVFSAARIEQAVAFTWVSPVRDQLMHLER